MASGTKPAAVVHVRFERRAEVGSRFTNCGLTWELTEERLAKPGAIEGGDTYWAAKPADQ